MEDKTNKEIYDKIIEGVNLILVGTHSTRNGTNEILELVTHIDKNVRVLYDKIEILNSKIEKLERKINAIQKE